MNARLTAILAGLLCAGLAHAQTCCPTVAPLPHTGSSPLLYVRFTGPQGLQTSFYQGRAKPRTFPAPVVVGMRPGYAYRVQLSNLPDRPALSLYPTVEVHGSLKMPPKCGTAAFPATVHLTSADLEAAVVGTMITKVIYLEDPDRADPTATRDGEILEYDVPRDRDIYQQARERGRVMLVVHLGERIATPEELAQINVPGTILMPGEKVIGPPACPPCFQGLRPGFYDPWHGPRPFVEECLHDGGDRLAPVGFDLQGGLGGVDPEDTVAEFRDSKGKRQITVSNRVCLCVPRFIALRKECPWARSEGVVGPRDGVIVKHDVTLTERKPPLTVNKVEEPLRFEGRQRPSINLNVTQPKEFSVVKILLAQHLNQSPIEYSTTKKAIELTEKQKAEVIKQVDLVKEFSQVVKVEGYEQILHTAVMARIKGADVIKATVAVRDLTVCCCETPPLPDKPLVLVKCADRSCAVPGEEVTFTLRYTNVGARPMSDVALVDSLSGRLEYVAGSAESDRDAVFTAQANEAGSQLLRWEVSGTLQPGQSGRVRFKAKVR